MENKTLDNLIGVYKEYLVQFEGCDDIVFWIETFINDLEAVKNGETFEARYPEKGEE